MKVDVSTVLNGLDGKPLLNGEQPLTLRDVATSALLATYPDEAQEGEEKFKRFQLAVRINADSSVDMTPEQAAKLKVLIGKGFGPLVVGPAYTLLNG